MQEKTVSSATSPQKPEVKSQVKPAVKPEPLTDPADLLALLGRFMSGSFLMIMTGVLILRQVWVMAAICGVLTILLQLSTTQLWRKLREERQEKLAARAEQSGISKSDISNREETTP
jgi:hypothetical protein